METMRLVTLGLKAVIIGATFGICSCVAGAGVP
jgi:hypothetical protein